MRVLNLILWGILSSTAFGQANSGVEVHKIAAGAFHTCALFNDGTVKCWGSNYYGQLGVGDRSNRGRDSGSMGAYLPSVDLGVGQRGIDIVVGSNHNCVLLENRKIKCWGLNEFGQLGLGDRENRGDDLDEMGDSLPIVDLGMDYRVRMMSVGHGSTCALLETGELKCWGLNSKGQLGLSERRSRGGRPSEMGNHLPSVDLGANREIVEIDSGSFHNCALLVDGALKCWGWNEFGQLGLGDSRDRGAYPEEMGDHLPELNLGSSARVVKVELGSTISCALFSDYTVKCWGRNRNGEIGQEGVLQWGSTSEQTIAALQPVNLGSLNLAFDLWVGAHRTCVVLVDQSAKCWGGNWDGELGLGDRVERGLRSGSMGEALPAVRFGLNRNMAQIDSGALHTCAKLSDGSVRCWGSNVKGQLGLESSLNRWGDRPSHMGDALPEVMLTDTE